MASNLKMYHRNRFVELALLVGFLLLAVAALVFNPSPGVSVVESKPPSEEITAYALAMPNQGWAPLTVYFSAFGSHAASENIVRYDWDLDANGRYDTDASATGGYTSYSYNKPGIYTVTLRVMDDSGHTATDSIIINARHPASSSVDYWTVFDDSQVRRVDISMTSPDWNLMWADVEAKLTVPADAVIFGEPLDDIGFRMRGQFSLRMSGEKKPFKIDTDAFVDGQEYSNLRQLMFLNNIGDPSMLYEKLAYEGMHFAGVPASHVCYVELWIDITDDDRPPEFWGVYSMVERIDKKFLANRFGRENDTGNLYKASHAQRGPMDLIYHGPDISDYPTQNGLCAYGKESNEEQNDYRDLINLIYTVDGVQYATPEAFASAVEQVLNVDSFLRYQAVVNTVANWDVYQYTGNNYYLYQNPGTGKFEWIPWDMTWGGNSQHMLFDRDNPGLVARAPLYDRVMEVERFRTRYAGYLDLLNRYWFTEINITHLARGYHEMIAPYVTQGAGDKMFTGNGAMFPLEVFYDSWEPISIFVRERQLYILNELAEDGWRQMPAWDTQIIGGGE